MQFTDRMTADGGLKRMADGYAALTARVARAGNVQVYRGAEIGMADREIVRVYRPEDAVFRRDALKTYAGVPVTLGHPAGGVSAATWKDHAVGEVGDEVVRDGEFVRVPMMLRDAAAIAAVEAGTRELSMGYDAKITMQDGTSPAGEAYDAVMGDFRMNHVAIVPQARGGAELRIGDGAATWGASPVTLADMKGSDMTDTLRMVVVGDEAVSTTDAGARAIEKLKSMVAAKDAAIADADKAHAAAIAAKDEEIGRLKVDLKAAQDAAKIDIDKLVADRAELVGKVRAIDAKIETAGKSDADLRKAAVAAKLGDDMVNGASDAEIAGMFKAIAKDAKPADPVALALKDAKPVADLRAQAEAARAANLQSLRDAWKGDAQAKH